MRFLRALGLLTALLPQVAAAQQAFFGGLADVPLMPGMAEVPGVGLVFVTPEGRIVEVEARATAGGPVTAASVRSFYANVLPPLGWEPVADGLYQRGVEALLLSLDQDKTEVVLRVSITPAAAP